MRTLSATMCSIVLAAGCSSSTPAPGGDLRRGNVSWVPAGGESVLLKRAEIQFDEFKEDRPVTGTYDLDMPDGTRERGRFEANWLPPPEPGG